MKVKVKDLSNGKQRVAVKVKRNVVGMPLEELAKEMQLKNNLIEYHYEVNDEYHNVDDIYDSVELICDMLAEFSGDDEADFFPLAEELLEFVKEDVIEEIFERDDDARDYAEVLRERY